MCDSQIKQAVGKDDYMKEIEDENPLIKLGIAAYDSFALID